jgi:hypothetical protein
MWSAKIIKASQIDSAGFIDVVFDVFYGEEKKFEAQSIRGMLKDSIESDIRSILQKYQNTEIETTKLKVGDVITIEAVQVNIEKLKE